MEVDTKNGKIVVYAKTYEQEALQQVIKLSNSDLGVDANIVMMPDMHLGKGCCIGTTMRMNDKVCPNIVGVDIGCGVTLAHTNIRFEDILSTLDDVIRQYIPSGRNVHTKPTKLPSYFSGMYCWGQLKPESKNKALYSCGTLGGGNHFIEAYENGYISVHTGSRNIGLCVAQYYQSLAENYYKDKLHNEYEKGLLETEPRLRGVYVANFKRKQQDLSLAYLEGEDFNKYIHDVSIMCEFARDNRDQILKTIVAALGGRILDTVESIHNYVGNDNIIRKGAIPAYSGRFCVIPLNMRDGILICRGKGNSSWNSSAPHGAGRIYGRKQSKQTFTMDEFRRSMKGIYSTSITPDTLDEAPFAYKDMDEIIQCIEPTVSVMSRLKPIYNFKAGSVD